MRLTKTLTGASIVVAAFFAALTLACGGGSTETKSTADAHPTVVDAPSTPAAAGTCGPATSRIASIPRSNKRNFSAVPETVIDQSKSYTVTMKTVKGDIVMDLAPKEAPITVNSFVFLSCDGFYDGLIFHRVEKGPPPFVIQGGDPRGDGRGGPGYIFKNEISSLKHDKAGTLAMANSGPDTNGSQFYITLGVTQALDGNYTVFGYVTSGIGVVNSIAVGDKILSVSVEEK